MKNRSIYSLIILFLIFAFVIFYKSLNKSNLYEPKSKIKDIPEFVTISFFEKEDINSKTFFNKNKFYLLNIWASWCVPCREEHPLLIDLSDNNKLEIIGLNYKDNIYNAKLFLKELGNPYKEIFLDKDGTLAVEWGAYGVPESFLIHKNKIIKKFIGPLNIKSVEEIQKNLK